MSTLEDKLAEAEAALHSLLTGRLPVTLTDSNGESVTYNHASRGALGAYVQSLKNQIAGQSTPGVIYPTTSKGL